MWIHLDLHSPFIESDGMWLTNGFDSIEDELYVDHFWMETLGYLGDESHADSSSVFTKEIMGIHHDSPYESIIHSDYHESPQQHYHILSFHSPSVESGCI